MQDIQLGGVVRFGVPSRAADGSAANFSAALVPTDIRIFKRGDATPRPGSAGVTVSAIYASLAGYTVVEIDTSNNTGAAGWWERHADYLAVVVPGAKTVDGIVPAPEPYEFSIEHAPAPAMERQLVSTVTSQTEVVLPGGSDVDDAYNGFLVTFRHLTVPGLMRQARCLDYVGATQTMTTDVGFTNFTMTNNLVVAEIMAVPTSVSVEAGSVTSITAALRAMEVEAEGNITLQQSLSSILATLAGISTGQDALSPQFLTPNGNALRVAGTLDAQNNRTAVSLTPSA